MITNFLSYSCRDERQIYNLVIFNDTVLFFADIEQNLFKKCIKNEIRKHFPGKTDEEISSFFIKQKKTDGERIFLLLIIILEFELRIVQNIFENENLIVEHDTNLPSYRLVHRQLSIVKKEFTALYGSVVETFPDHSSEGISLNEEQKVKEKKPTNLIRSRKVLLVYRKNTSFSSNCFIQI